MPDRKPRPAKTTPAAGWIPAGGGGSCAKFFLTAQATLLIVVNGMGSVHLNIVFFDIEPVELVVKRIQPFI